MTPLFFAHSLILLYSWVSDITFHKSDARPSNKTNSLILPNIKEKFL